MKCHFYLPNQAAVTTAVSQKTAVLKSKVSQHDTVYETAVQATVNTSHSTSNIKSPETRTRWVERWHRGMTRSDGKDKLLCDVLNKTHLHLIHIFFCFIENW